MEYNKFKADLPYLKVEVDTPSMSDVKCLMEDYGGMLSETTAIMIYIYQSYISKLYGEEWAEMFMGIAKVEMHHHELLAEAIVKCGGNPIIAGNRQFWSGSFVSYQQDLCKMIEKNLMAESMAIANYKKTIKCLNNYSIKELIERIILDEEVHIRILNEALEKAKCKKM